MNPARPAAAGNDESVTSAGIIRSALDAIVVIDDDDRILEFNPAAERLFGHVRSDVVGREMAALLVPEQLRDAHRNGLRRQLQNVDSPLQDRRFELVALRRDGSRIPIELSITRLRKLGKPLFAAFIRDLTQQRALRDAQLRSEARMAALVQAQQDLVASAAAPHELMDTLALLAQRALGGDGAAFGVVEGDELVYRAASGIATPRLGLRLPVERSLSGMAIRAGRALWSDDAEHDPRVDREACHALGLRSVVVAPVREDERTLGVIKVMASAPRRFDDSDARALELLAASVAAVLRRTQAEAAQQRMLDTQSTIVEIQRELATSDVDSETLMDLMALHAQTVTGADGASVELIDGNDTVAAAVTGSLAELRALRSPIVGSLSGLCIDQRRPLLCDDAERDARVSRDACRRMQVRSLIVAPLRTHDAVIGVLKVVSTLPGAFGAEHARNLEFLSETLGLLIHRRRAAERLERSESQNRQLLERNPVPAWVIDAHSQRILAANRAAVAHYGYSEADFRRLTASDLRASHPEADVESSTYGAQARRSRHRRRNGDVIDVLVSTSTLQLGERDVELVLAVDVTGQLAAEAGMARANRALRMLSACERAVIRIDDEVKLMEEICRVVVDIGGYDFACVFARDAASREPRYRAVACRGHADMVYRFAEPAERPLLLHGDWSGVRHAMLEDAVDFPLAEVAARLGFRSGIALPLSDGGAPAALVCMYSDRGDPPQPQEFALLQDLAENVSFGLGALRTARENQRAQADLTYAASHDLVTGLPRFAAIEATLAGWLAPDDATLALLMIDLDRFHAVNESLGHRRADEVLACMGTRLRAFLAPGVALAHFAGDEYVVARTGVDEVGAIAFADELRAAIAAPLEGDGYRVQLSSTIGVALAPAHGRAPLDLLRRAQFAMERGKKRGRDRVEPFRLEQMQDIEDRVLLGERLRQATANGELRLHYQPQIDAQTRRIVGFEALLRWTHPELGSVSPARFIPIGESLGLMPDIGGWVLREACRQARAWIDAGREGFTVAVNVSPQQLQRDGLVQAVADALTEARLPPHVLEIEFTETSLMENVTRVQGELAKLKALGVTLSLDDFGTGYSSLAYLKQFSLDKLKIDQGFVRGLPANADDAAIAGMIVAIGHQLRLCVVAEGVETAEQADFLQRLGCDGLQGYHFGRPLAVEDVAQRWAAD